MDWTETQLAYMAGMVDGEGSISVFGISQKAGERVYRGNRLILSVYNNDEAVMLWMQRIFGGKVRSVKRARRSKQSFVWETGWQHARLILEALLPYLIIKHARAELFIEFAKTSKRQAKFGAIVPEPIALRRHEIIAEMKKLNMRGTSALVN